MKYIVDEIMDNYIRCENVLTSEMVDIDKSLINFDIKDGDCIIYADGEYFLDLDYKKERENTIREKLERLKNL